MLRSLLAYSRVAIPAAEITRSDQHQVCKKVQKEARCKRDSDMRNGPRHGHKRSGGIALVAMVDPVDFAAGRKPSWAAGRACAVWCRKGAEKFTFLAGPRWLPEVGEGVTRLRGALGGPAGWSCQPWMQPLTLAVAR